MFWTVITPPTDEPVTLEEARDQIMELRDVRGPEVLRKIRMAREHVETYCERALMPQSWALVRDDFPRTCDLLLPGGLVRSITSVEARQDDGTYSVVDPEDYSANLVAEPARLRPVTSWPAVAANRVNGARVVYEVGYASKADIPMPLIEGILLLVADSLENRQAQQAEVLNPNMHLHAYLKPYCRITP